MALTLLDDRVSAAGSACGVTRDEIAEAFGWLTSRYVGRAVWTDATQSAIVIRPVMSY